MLITDGSYNNVIGGEAASCGEHLIANNTDQRRRRRFGHTATPSSTTRSMTTRGWASILSPAQIMNQAAPVLTSVQPVVAAAWRFRAHSRARAKRTSSDPVLCQRRERAEGKYFFGSQSVTTNANGIAAFTYLSPLPPGGASFFMATATDAKNNTSEFSTVIS